MYHRFSTLNRDWKVLLLLWLAVVCLTGWMIFTSGGGPIGGTGVPVFIDSGSTTAYLDSTGTTWSADSDVTGGVSVTSTTTVTNTADPVLFQTFRTAPSGNIVYAVPIAGGGLFQVSELEAELNTSFAKGGRIQNIVLACDGTQIASHNNFDILDPLGPCGGNTAVGRACTITDWILCGSAGDSTNHTISITFNAVADQAQVNAIRIIPNAQAIIAQPTPSATATPPPLNALGPQIISCAGGVGTGDIPLTVNLSPGEGLVLLHRGNTSNPADPGVSDSLGNTWTLDTGVSGMSVNGPSSGCLNVDYVASPIGKGTGGSDTITAKSPGTGLPNLAIACEVNDFGGLDAANGVGITPYTTTVSASSVTPQLTLDTLLGMFDVEVPGGGATPAFSGSPFNSVGTGTPQNVPLSGTPFNSTLLVGAPSEQGVFQNTVVIQQNAAPAGNYCGGLTALQPVVAFVGRSQGFVPSSGGPVMAANDFLNTMGVNTAQTQGQESTAEVQAEVEYLGVRNIRDDQTDCLNHTTTVRGVTVGYCGNFNTLVDYCNDHNGTVNTTVGTVITGTGGLRNGASNPYGIMVNMLPEGNPVGTQECDTDNSCMQETMLEYDYFAKCGISPATANIIPFVEGMNEPENDGHLTYRGANCGDNGTNSFAPCAAYMNDLWKLVHGQATSSPGSVTDTILPALGLKVSDCTQCGTETDNVGLQFLQIPPGFTGTGAVGTNFADVAGLHNYMGPSFNGETPYDNISWLDFSNALGTGLGSTGVPGAISKFDNMDGEYCNQTRDGLNGFHAPATGYPQCNSIPKNTTETGWGGTNISPQQAGSMALNAYLSAAAWGEQHMFWYGAADNPKDGGVMNLFQANPNQQPTINPWPAARDIHNLTSILSDITSAFTTTAITVNTSPLPSTVHSLLLQKSNGTYEYNIWDDRPVGEGTDNVTVTLPQNYSTVNVYDPTMGTAPVQTLMNAGQNPTIQLTLSDHPNIVEFNLGAPIPSLGPSPTPIPAPSVSPTPTPGPGATPVPGAPTISDYEQVDTQANTTTTTVFPVSAPANGSTLVFIATEQFNPVANFALVDSKNNAIPVLLPAISNNGTVFQCGSVAPCGNVLEVFCKNASNETGNGYTLTWSGGSNGSGYVQNSLIVLQNTTCQKLDGTIKTVAREGTSATIPAISTTAADIVLWATAEAGGTSPVNIALSNGYGYDLLSPNPSFNAVTAADWLPTNTQGPTVTMTDTVTGEMTGVAMAFHE